GGVGRVSAVQAGLTWQLPTCVSQYAVLRKLLRKLPQKSLQKMGSKGNRQSRTPVEGRTLSTSRPGYQQLSRGFGALLCGLKNAQHIAAPQLADVFFRITPAQQLQGYVQGLTRPVPALYATATT